MPATTLAQLAGHVAAATVHCLLPLECRVTVIAPREAWLARVADHPRLEKVLTDDLVAQVARLPTDAFVLCMTMGHRTDRPILEAIFRERRTFPYLGVIGSQAKRKILQRELTEAGVTAEQLATIHCPIGFSIGNNLPAEIAISVAAELIQCRDARRSAAASPGRQPDGRER